MPQALQGRVRLGPFELDTRAGELQCDGRRTVLQEQQLKVLLMLIERGGGIVTREDIKKKLWPNDTVVEFDFGINNTVKKLRRCLGDSAENPRYIETVARRGYRLVVPVEWLDNPSGGMKDPAVEESSAASSSDGSAVSEAVPKAKLKVRRLTGIVVSHYRVLEVIGGGGMGLVYRAEDLKLGRAVALKFLPEEVGDDTKARERFEREAKAVSALSHTNICPIYEFDEYEGLPFLVMELLRGRTLRDHLADARFRLTQAEGLEIAIQIASGLEAAHEKGIIHRDIKPANIFITEKNVAKILDFGVAKVLQLSESVEAPDFSPANGEPALKGRGLSRVVGVSDFDARENQPPSGLIPPQSQKEGANGTPEGVPLQNQSTLTRTGAKLGTAGYMSPEQVRGEPLDARTDIFSFGLVLYEMATGERAFTGETEAMLHEAIQHREPKPVRELAPEISPAVEGVITRCLQKKLTKRFQTAAEMKRVLAEVANHAVPLLAQEPEHGEVNTSRRRRWLTVAAIAMVCAAASWLYWRLTRIPKLRAGATIVLADTVNETNDAALNQALGYPLATELLQTPFFNGLSRDKIRQTLKALNQSEDSRLTPDLARRVCVQTGSDAVVQSSISDAGNRYIIALVGVRCDTGSEIARARVEADERNRIVRMLGVAGAQLRRKLGEPADSVKAYNTVLDQATSASLEALEAMAQGQTASGKRGTAAALPYYKKAVELDPKCALAQMGLGIIYVNAGENDRAAESIRAAFALRNRGTQYQKASIESQYYSVVTGEIDQAIGALERLLRIFPQNMWGHSTLAWILRIVGQPDRAAAQAREAFRIAPNFAEIYNLALSEMAMGQPENAKQALDEAQKLGLGASQLGSARYLLAFYHGDHAAMRQEVAWAKGKPEFETYLMAKEAETAAYLGRFRRARMLAAQAASSAEKDGISETSKRLLLEQAFRDAEVGDVDSEQNTLAKIRPVGDGVYMSSLAAITMANSGDIMGAERLTARITENHPLGTLAQKFWLPAAWALIDLNKNNPAQAIQRLEVYSPLELAQPGEWEPFGNMYPTYVRGLAYLKANQGDNAAKEFQRIIDHRGLVLNFIIGALAHLQLARAQVMMGDKDAAHKSYQDFLTLWKDADPDIPIYRQAKAEYAKLK